MTTKALHGWCTVEVLTEGIYSCLFHIPSLDSTGPATIPTRQHADCTPDTLAASSRRHSATSLDLPYPIGAAALMSCIASSGAEPGPLQDPTAETLDTNMTNASCADSEERRIRLRTPLMCGSKDDSAQLKFTGH